MSVIMISRGTFSGGKILAEALAKELDFRCLDREVVVQKAAESGVSPDELRKAMEKPPTFLDRLKHNRYVYLALMQAALAEEVLNGKVVYHGHVGHLLLKGGGPVFRIRIIAPLEFRISKAQQRLQLSRNEVISYIEEVDHGRRKWAQYLYGVDWTDPFLYDLVINLDHIDLELARYTIISTVREQRCFEFDSRCQAAMNDLACASRVKANLAINASTSHLELEVDAKRGVVQIKGKITNLDQVEEIRRVAEDVPGVTDVNLDHLGGRVPD